MDRPKTPGATIGTPILGGIRVHVRAPEAELLPRHLIDVYTHKSQTVRCECGWIGSSASPDGSPSAWKRHVAESKSVKDG